MVDIKADIPQQCSTDLHNYNAMELYLHVVINRGRLLQTSFSRYSRIHVTLKVQQHELFSILLQNLSHAEDDILLSYV